MPCISGIHLIQSGVFLVAALQYPRFGWLVPLKTHGRGIQLKRFLRNSIKRSLRFPLMEYPSDLLVHPGLKNSKDLIASDTMRALFARHRTARQLFSGCPPH